MHTQLKYGLISDTDPAKGLVRVAFPDDDDGNGGAFVSHWIPVLFSKTLNDKVTFPFDVQEQVVCMMDEHCENGIVMGSIYSKTDLPDGAGADIHRVLFKDGSSVQFNRSTGDFVADFKGKATITSTGDMQLTSSAKVKINATGDVEVTTSATAKVAANSVDITAASSTINGNLVVTGNTSLAALAFTSVGGAGITIVGGVINATEVSASGKLLSTHTHPETGTVTGPPL